METSIILVGLWLAADAASVAVRYAVTGLGVLSVATQSVATAISSNGTVLGRCTFAGGLTKRALAWSQMVCTVYPIRK